ncbi:unnamed protein product, partial [marine sediment metagenome]
MPKSSGDDIKTEVKGLKPKSLLSRFAKSLKSLAPGGEHHFPGYEFLGPGTQLEEIQNG